MICIDAIAGAVLFASVPYLVIARAEWLAELRSHIHFVFFQSAHASHAAVVVESPNSGLAAGPRDF